MLFSEARTQMSKKTTSDPTFSAVSTLENTFHFADIFQRLLIHIYIYDGNRVGVLIKTQIGNNMIGHW